MGVEVEGAGDQHVEAGIHGFAGGRDQILPADRTVFWADQDRGPPFGAVLAFEEDAARADEVALPRRQALEGDAVAFRLLLDALGLQVVDDDCCEILAREVRVVRRAPPFGGVDVVDQFLIACRQNAVRRQTLDRERPGDTDTGVVEIGLVVEIFDIGPRGDRGIDLPLASDTRLPPFGVRLLGGGGRSRRQLARNLPFLVGFAEGCVQLRAQRLQYCLPFLPDVVDQRVVGDGFERDVRHALIDEALA